MGLKLCPFVERIAMPLFQSEVLLSEVLHVHNNKSVVFLDEVWSGRQDDNLFMILHEWCLPMRLKK